MKRLQFIRKTISVLLYLVVLYYLLPYRPAHLYYLAHHAVPGVAAEFQKAKAQRDMQASSFKKQFASGKLMLTKKYKVKFFFKTDFLVPEQSSNETVFLRGEEIHSYTLPPYQPPQVFNDSGRGPPLA